MIDDIFYKMVAFVFRSVFFKCRTTVSGLAKVAIFTTNVDAENQTLINHKCVCGALNRLFCQTRVSTSPFFSVVLLSVHFGLSWCVCLIALLHFFVWNSALKKCKCATKCVGYFKYISSLT